MRQRAGETIGHYRLLNQIGQGGMGVVYRAEDTRLKREVALKFLPSELSDDAEARDRFMREAQAASALQHNNICTVHDIDQTEDGQLFIVMDLYPGETLRERIEQGMLPLPEALEIAAQIGQGLAHAHEHGIIHRDVKPANVLLTQDGTVKILDFGLAKLGTGGLLTRVGTTLGTAAYMSPEQTRAETVDGRSDIWSLGVILYQMLTGRLPFGQEHHLAVIYSIQNSEIPLLPLQDLPAKCREILVKALQKDPNARYQHISEMVAELRKVQTGLRGTGHAEAGTPSRSRRVGRLRLYGGVALFIVLAAAALLILHRDARLPGDAAISAPALRRIAVLPLTNLRADPETDFLGFALADQIIGNLSFLKNLIVRPSSSVRKYLNAGVDLAAAGQDLNVDLVLTGTYLKELNTIRLSLELADVHTNAIVWRGAMQEQYVNTFRLEDTVAQKVVEELRVQFSPEELQQMRTDTPRNPIAYEYYLRAVSFPVSAQGNRQAVTTLHHSIVLDSTFAPAYGALGFRYWQLAAYDPGQLRLRDSARSAFQKALSLNPALLFAQAGLVGAYTELGQTEEAYQIVQKVLSNNPKSADGHFLLGYIARYVGFLQRGLREMETAVALDPNNARFRSIGLTYFYLGKYPEALRGFDLDSTSSFSLCWKAWTLVQMGELEQAVPYLNRVLEAEPESRFGLTCEFLKDFVEGRSERFAGVLRRSENSSLFDGESWYNLAEQHGRIGDETGTARTLQKAVDAGFFNYPLMLRDPLLEPVRASAGVEPVLASAKAKFDAFRATHPELIEE